MSVKKSAKAKSRIIKRIMRAREREEFMVESKRQRKANGFHRIFD